MVAILKRRATPVVKRLVADRSGASAVLIGLAMTVLVGMAGLGTEAGLWYTVKRNMQGAVDAAAYGAALALGTNGQGGGNGQPYVIQAKSITANHGFTDQANGVVVTVNNPPLSGHYVGNNSAVEVIVQQPQQRLLSVVYLGSDPIISARAVALRGTGSACVLALSGTAQIGTFLNGTTAVDLTSCGIAVNDPSQTALEMVGGSSITASSVSVVGNIDQTSQSQITTPGGPVTGASPIPDPFANLQIPSLPGCTSLPTDMSANANATVDASQLGGIVRFCSSLAMTGHQVLTLENGTFVIDGGNVDINNSTLNLVNATLIMTDSASGGANTGTINFHGGAVINATAPTTGSMAGMAIFVDRNASSAGTDIFSGGTTQNITGAVYDANRNVKFAGGNNTGGGNQCTKLVAGTITFNGNANMQDNCSAIFGNNLPSINLPTADVE